MADITIEDPKIIYLKDALLLDEEILPQIGIRVGILGHNRSDYDIMLMPIEQEQKPTDSIEISPPDKKPVEMRESIVVDKIPVSVLPLCLYRNKIFQFIWKYRHLFLFSWYKKEQIPERKRLSSRKFELEFPEEFPVKEVKIPSGKYDKARKKARRKWILREIKRHECKPTDTYSLATTLD